MRQIFYAVAVIILIAAAQAQWNDCPFGEVECDGLCGRYIDTDGNGICDHSEPAPADREAEQPVVLPEEEKPAQRSTYNFVPLTLISVALYAVSFGLVKAKKISYNTHKKIWNVLLTITFLVSGILGILLVIRINYGWSLPFSFSMLYWHVEAGIAMAVISVFHIIWHLNYYRCLLPRKKCED